MKYTLHVPVEQYGFIQVDDIESREEAITEYKLVAKQFTDGIGLTAKEFNEIIDEYLTTDKLINGGDFYENLSAAQKYVLNEVKKSKKRTRED